MAHQDGNTPGRTQETRTKLAHFKHPQTEGTVHYGEESWPIAAGVVECPLEVGEGAEWPRAYGEDVEAHMRALTGPTADDRRRELLQGSVADVEEALGAVSQPEELAALEQLESAGKKRKGVLEAIHARFDAIAQDENKSALD